MISFCALATLIIFDYLQAKMVQKYYFVKLVLDISFYKRPTTCKYDDTLRCYDIEIIVIYNIIL